MTTVPPSEEMKNTNRQAQQAAEATIQEATRGADNAAEQTLRAGEATADLQEQALREGTDILQRHAETVERSIQSGAKIAAQMTERSADQFNRAIGLGGTETNQATKHSNGNFNAVLQTTTVLAEAQQRLLEQWVEFANTRMERNFDRFDRLLRCRTPQDCVALQSELMRDNLLAILNFSRRVVEQSVQTADETNTRVGQMVDEAGSHATETLDRASRAT